MQQGFGHRDSRSRINKRIVVFPLGAKLPVGRYRLKLVATDKAGDRSSAKVLKFRWSRSAARGPRHRLARRGGRAIRSDERVSASRA